MKNSKVYTDAGGDYVVPNVDTNGAPFKVRIQCLPATKAKMEKMKARGHQKNFGYTEADLDFQ